MLHIIQTADGSSSIFNEKLNEHYHSTNGALTESMHIYIQNGLRFKLKEKPQQVRILEIGFGTGLNAILSYIEGKKQDTKIHYTALEPFPVPKEILKELNFEHFLNQEDFEIWEKLHAERFNDEDFEFRLLAQQLQEYAEQQRFDIIYFDAFAPSKQPDMWTAEMICKCASMLAQKGILVTYCSKGEFKRNLQNSGLMVEKLEGPPGKREIIRASRF